MRRTFRNHIFSAYEIERPLVARSESGQALVEYSLILLLVALVTVGSLTSIGTTVSNFLTAMANGL